MTRRALFVCEIVLLLAILGLAAHLRLANVTENPAWYTDETTHIDIAQNLLRGRVQYMAVKDSTLLFARPPLFHLLLAAQLGLAGPDADPMQMLRTFTGALGVLSVLLVYVAARMARGPTLALLAAFALAIYPQAIVYSRFGFSYNLLAPLVLLALLGLSQFARTGRRAWLALAALAIGLGTVSEIAAFTLVVPFILIVLLRRPKALLWSLPLLLLPFAVYALVMLARVPDAFLFDLRFTLARLGGGKTLEEQYTVLTNNYGVLLSESIWMPLGIVGLFLLRPPRFAWAALALFVLPVASIGRAYALYSLSAYYLIPFLPLVALGVASLIEAALRNLHRVLRDALRLLPVGIRSGIALGLTLLALVLLVGVPLLPSFSQTLQAVQTGFPTPIDTFLVNPRAVRAVAAYVNDHSTPDDIVVTSPVVGWLLHTNIVDFQMTAAATGRTTPHLPGNLPPERWAFPMAYTAARFIVVDSLWYSWGVLYVPGLRDMLDDIETWPRAFESGGLIVYRNPAL